MPDGLENMRLVIVLNQKQAEQAVRSGYHIALWGSQEATYLLLREESLYDTLIERDKVFASVLFWGNPFSRDRVFYDEPRNAMIELFKKADFVEIMDWTAQ